MRFNSNKGQSLFEVVIALAMCAIVVMALVAITTTSVRNATFSKNKSEASRYAEAATEWIRSKRDSAPIDFQQKVLTTTWCLAILDFVDPGACGSGEKISNTIFEREVVFSQFVQNSKTITEANILVSWQDAQGTHEVRSATYYSDWRER